MTASNDIPREEARGLWATVRAALAGEEQDFSEGSLRRAIPLLAIPMVLEMFMEALFSIVDVVFVARLGPAAVATVGLTESVLSLHYAIAFGVAMPVTAMVARRIGEQDSDGASEAGAQALMVAVAIGAVLALTALLSTQILRWMGGDAEVVRLGFGFAVIHFASSPLLMLLFVNNGIFRGAGDAATAMRALWLANGLNIILDPCFIFGWGPFPEWGVTGAAVATLIGRGAGVLYQLWHLDRHSRLKLRGHFHWRPTIIKRLLYLSWNGALQHLIETGSWIALVRIVAIFGSAALAGYTIAVRILLFTLMPAWGFSNATATLVGQSLGAGNPERAERAVWMSGNYAMVALGVVALVFLIAPDWLAGLFTEDPEAREVAAGGVFIIAFGYLFYGWQMVTQQAFNGAGDTVTPARIYFGTFWVLQIPLAWLLAIPGEMGPNGVWMSATISYCVAAVIGVVLIRRGSWKQVEI